MNKWIALGNLGKDPEVRYTNDGKGIATFSLAVRRKFHRDGDPESDWFDCVAFGKTAEFIEKYLRKGSKVLVEGQVQNNNYTDKNGTKRYGTRILLDEVEFAESKKSQQKDEDSFIDVNDLDVEEDDIPFA